MPIDYVVNESRFADKGVKFSPQRPALIQYLLISASHPKTERLVEEGAVFYSFDWESAVENLHGIGSKTRFLSLIKELAQEGLLGRHKSNRPGKPAKYCFTELFFGLLGYQHVEPKKAEKQPVVKVEKEIVPFYSIMPPHLSENKEFLIAWGQWCLYRKERKPAVTERGAKMSFNKIDKAGITASIQAIEAAITAGYQGFFPEKFVGNSNSTIKNQGKHEVLDTESYERFQNGNGS